MRYRHSGVLCKIQVLDETTARLSFVEDWSTVSPGQAAVFYKPEAEEDGSFQVLGGGIIEREDS